MLSCFPIASAHSAESCTIIGSNHGARGAHFSNPTLIHARNAGGEEGMDEGAMKGHDKDARWGDVIMRETWGPGEGRGKANKTNIITRK